MHKVDKVILPLPNEYSSYASTELPPLSSSIVSAMCYCLSHSVHPVHPHLNL